MTFDVSAFLDRRRLSRYNYVLIALSCLITLFDGLDMVVIAFIAPYIRDDLRLSTGQLGALFSAGMAGMVLGGLVFGWLGDRYGRRPLILVAAFAFGILTLATAAANTYNQLMLLRFADGFAIGGLLPLCWSLNIECVGTRVRASVITSITIGYSLGAAAAGPLTNWIAPEHGWRLVFAIAGLSSIAAAALLSLALPESLRFLVARGRHPLAIRQLLHRFDPSLQIAPGTQFVLPDDPLYSEERRVRVNALFYGKLLWLTPLLWLAYSASSVALTVITSWNPTFLEGLQFSRADAATASAVANAAGAGLGLVLMRFTDRYGPVTVILLPALAAPMLLVTGLVPLSPATFIIVTVIAQSLVGGAHFAVLSITGLFYPTSLRARGTAFAASIGKTSSVFGPLLAVAVLSSGLPSVRVFAFLATFPAILALSAAGITALVRYSGRKDADDDPLQLSSSSTIGARMTR